MMVIFARLNEADWLGVFLTDRTPHLRAYWQALQDRPSYADAITAHHHPNAERGRRAIVALKDADPAFRAALQGKVS